MIVNHSAKYRYRNLYFKQICTHLFLYSLSPALWYHSHTDIGVVASMIFQSQPSNKGKKKSLYRRKQGSTYTAHAAALDADREQPLDTANKAVGNVIPPSASSNKRKDDN